MKSHFRIRILCQDTTYELGLLECTSKQKQAYTKRWADGISWLEWEAFASRCSKPHMITLYQRWLTIPHVDVTDILTTVYDERPYLRGCLAQAIWGLERLPSSLLLLRFLLSTGIEHEVDFSEQFPPSCQTEESKAKKISIHGCSFWRFCMLVTTLEQRHRYVLDSLPEWMHRHLLGGGSCCGSWRQLVHFLPMVRSCQNIWTTRVWSTCLTHFAQRYERMHTRHEAYPVSTIWDVDRLLALPTLPVPTWSWYNHTQVLDDTFSSLQEARSACSLCRDADACSMHPTQDDLHSIFATLLEVCSHPMLWNDDKDLRSKSKEEEEEEESLGSFDKPVSGAWNLLYTMARHDTNLLPQIIRRWHMHQELMVLLIQRPNPSTMPLPSRVRKWLFRMSYAKTKHSPQRSCLERLSQWTLFLRALLRQHPRPSSSVADIVPLRSTSTSSSSSSSSSKTSLPWLPEFVRLPWKQICSTLESPSLVFPILEHMELKTMEEFLESFELPEHRLFSRVWKSLAYVSIPPLPSQLLSNHSMDPIPDNLLPVRRLPLAVRIKCWPELVNQTHRATRRVVYRWEYTKDTRVWGAYPHSLQTQEEEEEEPVEEEHLVLVQGERKEQEEKQESEAMDEELLPHLLEEDTTNGSQFQFLILRHMLEVEDEFFRIQPTGREERPPLLRKNTIVVSRASLWTDSVSVLSSHSFVRLLSHNPQGISVQFRDEPAYGDGVRREWMTLLRQALLEKKWLVPVDDEDHHRPFVFAPASNLSSSQVQVVARVWVLSWLFGTPSWCVPLHVLECVHVCLASVSPYFQTFSYVQDVLPYCTMQDESLVAHMHTLLSYTRKPTESAAEEEKEEEKGVEALGLTMVWKDQALVPSGEEIPVTSDNVHEYVLRCVQAQEWRPVYGPLVTELLNLFSELLPTVVHLFDPRDWSAVVASQQHIDVELWKQKTTYQSPLHSTHQAVHAFWKLIEESNHEFCQHILQFATGSPFPKWCDFSFQLVASTQPHQLPTASTCFHRLVISPDATVETLRTQFALIFAHQGADGFALR